MDRAEAKYVQIQLPHGEDVDVEALDAALQDLNKRFEPDDFYVVRGNSTSIELWLREVDVEELIAETADVVKAHPAAQTIQSIPNAAMSIHSYGMNGRKRLFVGYNDERKVVDRKHKEKQRGKHFYANNHGFDDCRSDLPADFENAVICGDSEEVLKRLPDACVDLVFTSPPYNFGLDYSGDPDAVDWQDYFDKLFRIFDECIRVLVYGGRIVVNVQPLFSDYIPSHHVISNYLMSKRLIWKGEILWEKNNFNCKYTAWGSWKSPSNPYLKYTWEFVEVFCKGALKKTGERNAIDIDAESFKKWVIAKWSIAPERRMSQFGHPAMFPVELARRVLLLFSYRGDIVLDPFAGVGTTCVAAHENSRRFIGVDVSPEYCEVARSRLEETNIRLI